MIRVLHVFPSSFGKTFSGDNKLWYRVFKSWKDSQVQHFILFAEKGLIVEANRIGNIFGENSTNKPYVRYHRWRRAVWAIQLLFNLVFYRKYYDLIHVHALNWGGLLIGPLSKLINHPSIRSIVRMDSDDPSTLVKDSLGRIKLWCFKQYNRILCISEALRQDCLKNGLKETQVNILLSPVDHEIFKPVDQQEEKLNLRQKIQLPKDSYIILSVGSVIHRKGVDILADTFISLAGDFPTLYLVFVGPASKRESISVDENFIIEIRAKLARSGLSERVLFTGRVDEDESLAKYYQTADLFVFPTRQEGLPNVLLEAMASGLPCVASHLTGITDSIIHDGVNGFLIPPEDPDMLAKKVELLLVDENLRKRHSENARSSIIDQNGFDAWQTKLTNIYQSMIFPINIF